MILDNLNYDILDESFRIDQKTLQMDIVNYIQSSYHDYKGCREEMERLWLNSWASYFGTRKAEEHLRREVMQVIGNVKSDWRHKVNVGKAGEVVETLHAHLMASLFPNKNWFDVEALHPDYKQVSKQVKYYLRHKFREWRFQPVFANYLRQLIILGTSVLAMPWKDDGIEFKCLDMFDVFFNPEDPDSCFIRKLKKTRADIIIGIRSGLYDEKLIQPFDIVTLQPKFDSDHDFGEIEIDGRSQALNTFQGLQIAPYRMSDKVTLYEYWGDIHLPYVIIRDVCVTIIGGRIARIKPNTYKCGKPFIIGTYTPTVRQAYGVSGIQGSLGMLQQLNNTTNQLLDGVELAVNPMYTMVQDGTLRPDDIYTEPGKVLMVASHDALRPLPPPVNNFNLSFQQFAALESTIDKNTGTGPLVGAGQPRGGERVTAREIAAVQQAGGNRLLNVYTHIRNTTMADFLNKAIQIVQQFVIKDAMIPVKSPSRSDIEYYLVGPTEFKADYMLYPQGIEHISEKEDYARRRIDILSLVSELPDVNQRIDIWKLVEDIIRNVLYEDPDDYFIEQEQPDATSQMSASMEQLLQQNVAADGGASLFSKIFDQQLPPGAIDSATTIAQPELLPDPESSANTAGV